MRLALVLLFLAAPVAAQQTVVVPDVEITNEHPITNEINVEVMSDSVRLERIAAAVEEIAVILAECGCAEQPTTSNVVRIGQGALVLAAFFIGFQVKRVADGYDSDKPSNGEPSSDEPSEGYPESK